MKVPLIFTFSFINWVGLSLIEIMVASTNSLFLKKILLNDHVSLHGREEQLPDSNFLLFLKLMFSLFSIITSS